MKARGVKRGLPDILILHGPLTLWLELKSAKGRTTPEQHAFFAAAYAASHHWYVVRTVEGVAFALRSHGIPLRARVT